VGSKKKDLTRASVTPGPFKNRKPKGVEGINKKEGPGGKRAYVYQQREGGQPGEPLRNPDQTGKRPGRGQSLTVQQDHKAPSKKVPQPRMVVHAPPFLKEKDRHPPNSPKGRRSTGMRHLSHDKKCPCMKKGDL